VLTTIHLNIWLGIHLTRLSTEGLGPRHGEVRRAHQMLNAALIGKQSRESVESVLKKKRKAMIGRICRQGRF